MKKILFSFFISLTVLSFAVFSGEITKVEAQATSPRASWSFVSSDIASTPGVKDVASSSLTGTITLKVKAVGGTIVKPKASDFSLIFASSTEIYKPFKRIDSSNSIYSGVIRSIVVTPNKPTINDGEEYTVTIYGAVMSNNPDICSAQNLFMAIRDITFNVGGRVARVEIRDLMDFKTNTKELSLDYPRNGLCNSTLSNTTYPRVDWSFVSADIFSAPGVKDVASSSLFGTITLKAKAVGGVMVKPTLKDFTLVFASSTQTNGAYVTSTAGNKQNAYTASIMNIYVTPSDATIGDGGTYTVVLNGQVSSNQALPFTPNNPSLNLLMAVKDIDYTVGGKTVTNQTTGLDNFYTWSGVLTREGVFTTLNRPVVSTPAPTPAASTGFFGRIRNTYSSALRFATSLITGSSPTTLPVSTPQATPAVSSAPTYSSAPAASPSPASCPPGYTKIGDRCMRSISPSPAYVPATTPIPAYSATPRPVSSATPVPTSTYSPTYTPRPTSTPIPTSSYSPTYTPSPTSTYSPTYTPSPSPTSSYYSSPTPSVAPSSTPTPSPASTPTPTPIITPTPSPTPSSTPSPTPTPSTSPTSSSSPTPMPSSSPVSLVPRDTRLVAAVGDALEQSSVLCPVGYICTLPFSCPEGYVCTPLAVQPEGCPTGYVCTVADSSVDSTNSKFKASSGISLCYNFSAIFALENSGLSVGSSGSEVVALQTWLINNGFDIPSISLGNALKGYFGSDTKAAVKAFQTSIGVPSTGVAGPFTLKKINASCNAKAVKAKVDVPAPNRGSVVIVSPNGGEKIAQGESLSVIWDSIDPTQSVDVKLLNSSGQVIPSPIQLNLKPSNKNAQSLGFSTYPSQISVGQYKARVCKAGTDICDDSNDFFSIIPPVSGVQPEISRVAPQPVSVGSLLTIYATGAGRTGNIILTTVDGSKTWSVGYSHDVRTLTGYSLYDGSKLSFTIPSTIGRGVHPDGWWNEPTTSIVDGDYNLYLMSLNAKNEAIKSNTIKVKVSNSAQSSITAPVSSSVFTLSSKIIGTNEGIRVRYSTNSQVDEFDWILSIVCPTGVVASAPTNVNGGLACGVKNKVAPDGFIDVIFKNNTSVVQTVVAKAELLSVKDGKTVIASDEEKLSLPPTYAKVTQSTIKTSAVSLNPTPTQTPSSNYPTFDGTIKAVVYSANEDRAGAWDQFSSGRGYISKDPSDWGWRMEMKINSAGGKSIKSITVLSDNNGEAWSTSAELDSYGRKPYPLVIVIQGSSTQFNDKYYDVLPLGQASYSSQVYMLYGQKESITTWYGGKLIVKFTDGSQAVAVIPVSSIVSSQTTTVKAQSSVITPSPSPTTKPYYSPTPTPTLTPTPTSTISPKQARINDITQLYVTLLKRNPDQAGLDYWVNSGYDISYIKGVLMNTAEYYNLIKPTPTPTPTPNSAPTSVNNSTSGRASVWDSLGEYFAK
ncbi:MAG: peptidoglycan-binding protein [Candidatus Paceibacterota bacterium]|jgi:peptidoglycan hydrolase-like protein with peptidoglycan-binding domain